MESQETRSLSGLALMAIAVASGGLTWLCVRWFGAQDPLIAAIAVILVELFIASFGMIAILIAERVSATYLGYEKAFLEKPVEPRRLWLWRPLWEPRARYFQTRSSSNRTTSSRDVEDHAIRFPGPGQRATVEFEDWQPGRRAA